MRIVAIVIATLLGGSGLWGYYENLSRISQRPAVSSEEVDRALNRFKLTGEQQPFAKKCLKTGSENFKNLRVSKVGALCACISKKTSPKHGANYVHSREVMLLSISVVGHEDAFREGLRKLADSPQLKTVHEAQFKRVIDISGEVLKACIKKTGL